MCDFTPILIVTTDFFDMVHHHPYPRLLARVNFTPILIVTPPRFFGKRHNFTSILIVPCSLLRARFDITPILIVTTLFVQGESSPLS